MDDDFTILDQVPSVVHLNVGGRVFLTSRNTLCQVPGSLMSRMFSGEVPVSKVKQTDSVYFVDRDPTHFNRILNFMRDGHCVIPESHSERQELLAEAKYYQLDVLAGELEASMRGMAATAQSFNFRHLVLQHHAATAHLEQSLRTVLALTRQHLVPITPVTEVGDENRLVLYWLSASMPPANPTHLSFRYRGKQESHDIGLTVTEKDEAFEHWARLWNIYHNQQLLTTFRELGMHLGLKVGFHNRVETFKQDSQLDVVWKMYRVRSLVLSIAAA